MTAIPESEWRWCGYPGHLIVANRCLFHLTTRVGDFRVSTVGDYRPDGPDGERRTIGAGPDAFFETFVFRAADLDNDECGNRVGEVTEWVEIATARYATYAAAERGHMEMCRRYADRGEGGAS